MVNQAIHEREQERAAHRAEQQEQPALVEAENGENDQVAPEAPGEDQPVDQAQRGGGEFIDNALFGLIGGAAEEQQAIEGEILNPVPEEEEGRNIINDN